MSVLQLIPRVAGPTEQQQLLETLAITSARLVDLVEALPEAESVARELEDAVKALDALSGKLALQWVFSKKLVFSDFS